MNSNSMKQSKLKKPEDNILHIVLRDSISQELIGKACFDLTPLLGKNEKRAEWIVLRDVLGRDIGKGLIEIEPREMPKQMSTIKGQSGELMPETIDVDIEEVVETMKDQLAEMMWDTSNMFNNFRRRFLPDFWNFDLGLADSPFVLELVESKRRPHHRSRRHRRNKDITAQQMNMQQSAESGQGLKSGMNLEPTTKCEKDTERSEKEKMSGRPEVEIRSESGRPEVEIRSESGKSQ